MSGPSRHPAVEVNGLLHPPDSAYSPETPTSFHTPLSTPGTIRRALSEDDNRSAITTETIHPNPPPKPPPRSTPPTATTTAEDAIQAALLQSARLKMSSRDQEAMRKIRSTMLEHSDSGSSNSGSPLSFRFPASADSSSRALRPRGSTLSRQLLGEADQAQPRTGLEIVKDDKEERTPKPGQPSSTSTSPGVADWVIAVVGHEGVGKSTVIGKALRTWGMSFPVSIQTSDGHIRGKLKDEWKVEFLEMGMSALNLASDTPQIWPPSAPRVTGAVFCYDATRQSSLVGLNQAIARLAAESMPMVILACKSDPGAAVEVDAHRGNSIGEPYNVGLIEVTTKTPEGKSKMRNALRWLLYKLEQRQRRQQRKLASPQFKPQSIPSPPLASKTLETIATPIESDASSSGPDRLMWRQGLNMTPAENGGTDTASDHRSSSSSLGWIMKGPLTNHAVKPEEPKEEEEKDTRHPEEKDVAALIPVKEPPLYVSLEDLLNRLFTAIVSTRDDSFIRAFFLTYRRFCEPHQLMDELLGRIREVEEYAVSADIKNWALMKLTGALIDWSIRYPGDLHASTTQTLFREILGVILKYTFMAHLTADLIMLEQGLSEGGVIDIDESWSWAKAQARSAAPTGSVSLKSHPSTVGTELLLDGEVLYDLDEGLTTSEHEGSITGSGMLSKELEMTPSHRSISTSSLNFDPEHEQELEHERDTAAIKKKASSSDTRLTHPSATSSDDRLVQSIGTFSSTSGSGSGNALPTHVQFQATGQGQGQGQGHGSTPTPANSQTLAKAVHTILVMDSRTFATELTKMQWELFVAIRPRDVFRHDLGKETDDAVGKSILFFNHISRWVSTLILASPKAKHRARVYERFMLIASHLRRLNNYDSLYALLSGMQETSVHRLSSTHALIQVAPAVMKDFQSHIKLMDPRGGYVQYRKALENDIANGRPAIPLLTTILGLVSRLQGVRPEDRREDGLIQWDKFERFADILLPLSECQNRGPMVRGNTGSSFKKMIWDTPIITAEDALWERSHLLEPSGPGGTVGGKVLKRLANLGFASI